MVPHLLTRPDDDLEVELYHRKIQIGADGSILLDGSDVYAVHALKHLPAADVGARLHTIDYFHGFGGPGGPVCQTMREDDFLATELIAADRNGYVVCRLRHLQRTFRKQREIRRAKQYTARMVTVGKLLAQKIVG